MRPSTWFGCHDNSYQVTLVLFLVSFTIPDSLALSVVGGSNCTSACSSPLTVHNTNGSDIVCHDTDYNSTSVGKDFQACVSCEVQSEAIPLTGEQSDLGWALYNMRYALDWCLFGFPRGNKEIASAQCNTACGRISNALKTNLPNATASSTYDYCQDPNFLPNVGSCASCYKNVPNQLYLSNFLNTLEYACQNQPSPVLPFAVKPSDIFTYQPPSDFSVLGTDSSSSHGLSHDARVAIAISVPVAAFLLFSLLLVYFYVHKNAPPDLPHHSTRQHNYNEKHLSKSTSGWSKSPSRKGTHSRNRSSNSASQQVPYPAPLKPSKVAVPAPLRTRNSPIPFSRNYYQPTNYGLEKPSKPTPPPATYSPEMLPATRYSPPHTKSPSLEPQKAPRPGQSKPGLVSWERIAIQNAQIRAELGPSPSPISPLTKVQVVPKPRTPLSHRSSGSTKRERFPVVPSSSSQSPAPREERRRSAMKSPAPSEQQQQRQSVLTSPLSREETHPALRSPTLSEEIRTTLASPVSTEYDRDDDVTPSLDNSSLFRKESQDTTITPTTPTLFNNNNKRLSPFSPPLLPRQGGSISRQSTPFRQERQEAQEMVDRQERQQQLLLEIPEGDGLERQEHENANKNENRGSEDYNNKTNNPYERRRDASAGTPRASLSMRKSRGSLEGVMMSGGGGSSSRRRKSAERAGARKEVRWSKDVDYEG